MTEEEKEAVEHLNSFLNITEYVWIKEKERLMVNIKIALNLIENQQKELNNLKEIEQSHKEENGNLRVELENQNESLEEVITSLNKDKDKLIKANKKLDRENQAIYESINCNDDSMLVRLYKQEKEKNKSLKKQIKEMQEYYKNADFIFKDKIKEKIEELEKEQKEYKNSQEWEIQDDIVAQINILEDLLEEK